MSLWICPRCEKNGRASHHLYGQTICKRCGYKKGSDEKLEKITKRYEEEDVKEYRIIVKTPQGKMKAIKLENEDQCDGCPYLYFDENKSNPSRWIGEGYYVHTCKIFKGDLDHYLHHPLRLEECKNSVIVK